MSLTRRVRTRYRAVVAVVFALSSSVSLPSVALAGGSWTPADLDSLVAPIALYPDALVAQVMAASTYPLEIVEADRWQRANASLKGAALEAELAKQPWDKSVAWLVNFPDVLSRMAQNLQWTQSLGDAVLSSQADVMAAVQRMRQRAESSGSLQTTPQQTVVKEKEVIKIVPANPEVVYVPQYNPTIVYGSAWAPVPAYAYPTIYAPAPPGAVVASSMLSFGLGMAMGSIMWGGGCDWYRGGIYVGPGRWGYGGWGGNNDVNININDSFNRTNVGKWEHDPVHRGGVRYRDTNVENRYGAKAREGVREGGARRQGDAGVRDRAGDVRGGDRSGGDRTRAAGRAEGPRRSEGAQRSGGTGRSAQGAASRGKSAASQARSSGAGSAARSRVSGSDAASSFGSRSGGAASGFGSRPGGASGSGIQRGGGGLGGGAQRSGGGAGLRGGGGGGGGGGARRGGGGGGGRRR
ncbi:DUF3300 domain-containing protein [bacterium]|nr:DUF3300 domain-containing protein [bacterium]